MQLWAGLEWQSPWRITCNGFKNVCNVCSQSCGSYHTNCFPFRIVWASKSLHQGEAVSLDTSGCLGSTVFTYLHLFPRDWIGTGGFLRERLFRAVFQCWRLFRYGCSSLKPDNQKQCLKQSKTIPNNPKHIFFHTKLISVSLIFGCFVSN